jgi:hypothetical protein
VVASALAPLEAASKSTAAQLHSFDAAQEVPLQYMSAEMFRPLVGNRFLVHTNAARPVPLTLTAVEEVTAPTHTQNGHIQHFGFQGRAASVASSGPQTATFALRFQGPANQRLSQNTYLFESNTLGKFVLFIVPGARSLRNPTYTAIFSHLQ